MGLNLSHGRAADVGVVGVSQESLPPLGATPPQSRVDLRSWWPADRRELPLELEIGSGKGTFLVQQATEQPGVNYLGLEYARAYWRYAADRCRRHGLEHQVRLVDAEAQVFVTWRVADEAFRQVHIYFPDPWPKKRHHKRRLIQAPFLRELHRVLEPGGLVRLVTDHDDYFAWIERHVGEAADVLERLAFERPIGAGAGEVVGTNFERKYRREGRPFHAIALRKAE